MTTTEGRLNEIYMNRTSNENAYFRTSEEPRLYLVASHHCCCYVVLLVAWWSWDCYEALGGVGVKWLIYWIELFDLV